MFLNAKKQSLRDYLDWKSSLFLPLPLRVLEHLQHQTEKTLLLIKEMNFIKNPDLFTSKQRLLLTDFLENFLLALKPAAEGENDITRLSALAGEIMPVLREIDLYRVRGKLVLEERFTPLFWACLSEWNMILSQFRWIERTISAYIAKIEEEASVKDPPCKDDVKQDVKNLMKYLPHISE